MLSEARKPPRKKLALLGEGSAYPYLLTFRELEFSETGLPVLDILGNLPDCRRHDCAMELAKTFQRSHAPSQTGACAGRSRAYSSARLRGPSGPLARGAGSEPLPCFGSL